MLQDQKHCSNTKKIVVDLDAEEEREPQPAKLRKLTVSSALEQPRTTLDSLPPPSTSAQYNKNNDDESDDDLSTPIDEIGMETDASLNKNAGDSVFLFTKYMAKEEVN